LSPSKRNVFDRNVRTGHVVERTGASVRRIADFERKSRNYRSSISKKISRRARAFAKYTKVSPRFPSACHLTRAIVLPTEFPNTFSFSRLRQSAKSHWASATVSRDTRPADDDLWKTPRKQFLPPGPARDRTTTTTTTRTVPVNDVDSRFSRVTRSISAFDRTKRRPLVRLVSSVSYITDRVDVDVPLIFRGRPVVE